VVAVEFDCCGWAGAESAKIAAVAAHKMNLRIKRLLRGTLGICLL